MRTLVVFFSLLLSCGWALAANLKIKVVDPQSAAVSGARVVVYGADAAPLAIQSTGGDGMVTFSVPNGSFRVQVLASGFAATTVNGNSDRSEMVVQLRVAPIEQTVVVSADRTPLPSAEAGASTDLLDGEQLNTMQPVSAVDALRSLPGVTVDIAGRRGSLSSLFVRGGDSDYNKVIIDGVPVNEPGGTFDFGVVPMQETDHLELVRGADSALYGSDAMTSTVEMWSRAGSTHTPELQLGADGGNFATAHGYASLAGARGRFDFNFFADQFNTEGQGTLGFFPGTFPNDDYSNSSQGANIGVKLSDRIAFRFRVRHSNNRSGVQSFWNFNGQPLLPPDTDQYARQNNFLSSAELTFTPSSRWQHRLTGFEYHHKRLNVDTISQPGRVSPLFGNIDFPFADTANENRAGLDYLAEYWARTWARTAFGYHFEDENGFFGDPTSPPLTHGLRQDHEVFAEQVVTLGRASLIGGLRFVHNDSFGNKAVPRVAVSLLAIRGNETFSGTRLRFGYGTGIKEPSFEESFGLGSYGIVPNPNLKAEENRSFETGFEQAFLQGHYALTGTYFNNLFRNQIAFNFDPNTFVSEYLNLNQSLAHGAEVVMRGSPWEHLTFSGAYTYTSTQVLESPNATDPLLLPGKPLLRRPKHSGSLLVNYANRRWGVNVAGTAVGRRADSDFEGLQPPVTYSAGYGRVDVSGWRAINSRLTAYVAAGNILDRKYEEAAGYPALRANVRAGLRIRIGGE